MTSISEGWESGHGHLCAPEPRSFPRLHVSGCQQALWPLWRLDLRRTCFQASSHSVARIQYLLGFWTEGLSSLMTTGQRPLSVPCHLSLSKGSSDMSAGFYQSQQEKQKVSEA